MDATKIIGQNIKKYRTQKVMKLETLATSLRLNKTTLSKIENGNTEITISRLEKIAVVLGIDFNLLASSSPYKININNSVQSVGAADNNNTMNGDELVKRVLDLSERVMEISKK